MAIPPLAIDFDGARPSPQAVLSSGHVAVLRYLRDLGKLEAASYLDAGLGIGLIFEYAADRALSGAAGGWADGRLAAGQAAALGVPPGTICFLNVGDFVATADQIPFIAGYYNAFFDNVGPAFAPGGYGTRFIIDALAASGCKGIWWQNAMNDAGVTGDVVSIHAGLYQRVVPTVGIAGVAAGDVDEDVVLAPIPWWTATGVADPPPNPATDRPANLVPPKELDMSDMATVLDGNGNIHVFCKAADAPAMLHWTFAAADGSLRSVIDETQAAHNANPADPRSYGPA